MRFAVCKNLKGRLKAKLNLVVNRRFHLVLALIAAAAKTDDAPGATKHQRPAGFALPNGRLACMMQL
jgi:hypothetical protein